MFGGFEDVSGINKDPLIHKLTEARRGLIRTYVLHVFWFALMCMFLGFEWNQHGVTASVLLTLIAVPPVL